MDDRHGIEIPGTALQRVRSGAVVGAGIATLATVYVLGLYLLRGATPFERQGVTMWAVVLGYYGAGLLAGACLGALWPLRRSREGAALLGGVGGFLCYAAVGITAADPPFSWTAGEWGPAIAMGLVWAVLSATVMYRPSRPAALPPAPSRLRTVRPPADKSLPHDEPEPGAPPA